MANQCSICGENGVLYMAEYTAENGEKVKEVMCYKCIVQHRESGQVCQILHVVTGNYTDGEPSDSAKTDQNHSSVAEKSLSFSHSTSSYSENYEKSMNWTNIFKISNMVLLVASVISGMIGGAVLLIEEGWEFFGVLVGAPLGALAGFLAGIVTVSFAMVIVEISQKLSDICTGQKNQNELTQKLIDILEEKNK
jgi:hypothetical protein